SPLNGACSTAIAKKAVFTIRKLVISYEFEYTATTPHCARATGAESFMVCPEPPIVGVAASSDSNPDIAFCSAGICRERAAGYIACLALGSRGYHHVIRPACGWHALRLHARSSWPSPSLYHRWRYSGIYQRAFAHRCW